MKKLLIYLLSATILFAAGCSEPYDDSVLIGRVDNLENRVAKLEELCKQMNTNISSLQTLINALQNNDYVTGVTPITKDGETIGYTITFTKSKPITIYHGEDGKAGVNGTDGQDGHTPIIGVKQDTDGIYYWTLDGDWLLDDNGDKIKAQGTDGKDGENGEDGKDGVDGTDGKDGKDGVDGTDGKDGEDGEDGKDGITPQLKIENDYWYISYDNGKTWIQLGKAKGDDGQNGDNIFNNVTYDNDNVYFELNDGTVITLSRGMNLTSIIKDIVYIPTHSDNKISVNYYGRGFENKSNAIVDFVISPKNVIAQISKDNLKVFASKTQTRLAELIELEIRSYSIDKKQGVLTIDIDCSSFDEAFYTGDISYSIALCVVDDIGEVWSEFTTAVPVCHYPAPNEIWYTSSDGNIVTPYQANAFDSYILKNIYENGKGVITFSDKITSVGERAFYYRGTLESIYIPSSVENIDNEAFYNCSNLESVHIPFGVSSIGDFAFYGCNSLKSVIIPGSVSVLGASIFMVCGNLTDVEFQEGVKDTGVGTFYYCENLKNVSLPESLLSINHGAFMDCSMLPKIDIPSNVTFIGENAFLHCENIKSIKIPIGVTTIEQGAFASCASLSEIILPDNLEIIKWNAFNSCINLTSVILPQNLAKIEGYVFEGCTKLGSVYCKSITPPEVECVDEFGYWRAFDNNAKDRKLYVPIESVANYKSKTYWKDYAAYIVGYQF